MAIAQREDMGQGSAKILLGDSADMAGASASGALETSYYNTNRPASGPNCPEGALYSGGGDIGGMNDTYAQCGIGNTLGDIPLKRYVSSSVSLTKSEVSAIPDGRCPQVCRIYDAEGVNVVACGNCSTLGEFYPVKAEITALARGLYYSTSSNMTSDYVYSGRNVAVFAGAGVSLLYDEVTGPAGQPAGQNLNT